MNKLWVSDVVAVGNSSNCDTQGAGWWSVVKDEVVKNGNNCHTNCLIYAEKKVDNLDASSWVLLLAGSYWDCVRCSTPFNIIYSRRMSHPHFAFLIVLFTSAHCVLEN